MNPLATRGTRAVDLCNISAEIDQPHWQNLPCWRVLDTCFRDGQAFFTTWAHWRNDSQRPRVLHYVALCASAPDAQALVNACQSHRHLRDLAQALTPHWFGLLPGFHRFLLADGQVILTLCVGDALQSLRQQNFLADAVFVTLDAPTLPGDLDPQSLWSYKALASCCRRGSALRAWATTTTALPQPSQYLQQCGFALNPPADTSFVGALRGHYEPGWVLKTSRRDRIMALPIERCAVIGAGLAGASVAAALARRGWQVQVLDQAARPAAGASGLPVGLVVPHVSSDDCVLSRLSRAGVRMMLQQAQHDLQPGDEWSATGVFERQVNGTPHLPAAWPGAGMEWSQTSTPAHRGGSDEFGVGLWHPRAAWIKPAALVRAWLSVSGVAFIGNAQVTGLRKVGNAWQLLDASGAVRACAERVVFANACGAHVLLHALAKEHPELAHTLTHLPATHGMRGLLSWALHDATAATRQIFPAIPVNGSGSMVAHIPTEQGSAWFMGSSYQPDQQCERNDQDNHTRNFEHLLQLLPALARALEPSLRGHGIHAWKGTRCVSSDRLPQAGPLEDSDAPTLWMCAAMGSRGLSFSVLCAELLAARMGAEPLPVPTKLAQALYPIRARLG